VAILRTYRKPRRTYGLHSPLTELEHILLRPDTYIGTVEKLTQPMFVLNSETNRIVQKEISFTPGLYKIFDEILVSGMAGLLGLKV